MTREEAIRIIENTFQDAYVYKYYDSVTHQALDMAIEALKAEPKCVAQIKVDTEEIVRRIKEEYDIMGGWIPCSEGLPKKGEVVLITNGKGNVRCGQYRSEHDVRGGTHYWWWKGKTVETVIAWMPLPKPYKGGDDE